MKKKNLYHCTRCEKDFEDGGIIIYLCNDCMLKAFKRLKEK